MNTKNIEETFDRYITTRNFNAAFNFITERLVWQKTSLLKGMGIFLFRLEGDKYYASCMAEELIAEEPQEIYSHLTLLNSAAHSEFKLRKLNFFTKKGFILGIEWVPRLRRWGLHEDAKILLYCIARYSCSGSQKSQLVENFLVEERVPELRCGVVNQTQLELNLAQVQHEKANKVD
jgi:hypothetical protein